MKYLLLTALLVASPGAHTKIVNTSGPGSSCPVEFNPDTGPDLFHHESDKLLISFSNRADKSIVGIKFIADNMDSTGDFSRYPFPLDFKTDLKPGKKATPRADHVLPESMRQFSGVRVSVMKVAFEDGSTWEDDGTGKCQITRDYR